MAAILKLMLQISTLLPFYLMSRSFKIPIQVIGCSLNMVKAAVILLGWGSIVVCLTEVDGQFGVEVNL